METRLNLLGQSQTIQIGVYSPTPQQIHVTVSDAGQVNTLLTDRYNDIHGQDYFYIRLPLAPSIANVLIYNERTGPSEFNDGFTVTSMGRKGLERKMVTVDISNADVKSFVDWGQRFAYNAGHLKCGDYISPDGRIHFRYLPTITNESGQEINTPAQTGEITGIIEISQKKFLPLSVPERFAILCHEFAHYYRNINMYSEVEADLQGLMIYLGLGYPRYDGYNAFLVTFEGAPGPLNDKRKEIIKKFIDDYENKNFVELFQLPHKKKAA